MNTLEWINAIAQVFTAIGVIVAMLAIRSNAQINQKQMNMQTFMEFTKRYEEIMNRFPENAFQARYDLADTLPPESKELTVAALKYLNLASEEYYLWRDKYLDDKVWKIWESEIKRTIASPLFRREWPKIVSEFVSYPEFIQYVRNAQRT